MRRSLALLSFSAFLALSACGEGPDDDDTSAGCDLFGGDQEPTVVIDAPDNGLMVGVEDAINWIVQVEDPDSEVEEITLVPVDMSSGNEVEIDFTLPGPDSDGRAEFALSGDTLGSGIVVVRIVATDAGGCRCGPEDCDQVALCIDVSTSDCNFD